jgi:hypothetical protein
LTWKGYRSPEYQENIKVRLPHATIDLIVIEGYDGPQPSAAGTADCGAYRRVAGTATS